jgi:NTE family protein
MIAFVLSGGANRGPIEVGALQSLLAHNIRPDLVVGTSAGALNGAYFCAFPDAAGLDRLAQIWINTRREDAFPGNKLTWALRALFGADGLADNKGLIGAVKRNLTDGTPTFRDLKIPLYVTTADLVTALLVVYGRDLDAPLLEPVVASAAFPLVIEPLLFDGHQLTDGGVVAYAGVEIALQEGAKEIYVIDLTPVVRRSEPLHGISNVGYQILSTLLHEQLLDDLGDAMQPSIKLHHVNITAFGNLSIFDFSKTRELIAAGKAALDAYLDAPRPNIIERPTAAQAAMLKPPRGGEYMKWRRK